MSDEVIELSAEERAILVDVVGYIDQAAIQLTNAFHASQKGGFDPLSTGIVVAMHAVTACQRPALQWLGQIDDSNVDGAQA